MIWSSSLVELIGLAGLDLVVLDDQHGSMDPERMLEHIRVCELVGLAPLVRVPVVEPWVVSKFLDMGAQGIIFPGIRNGDDAARAVASVRYEPLGTRSSCPSTRVMGYTLDDWPTVYRRSNEEILTILLIETKEGFDNVDEILSVPGIDVVLPGPFDLASSLGLPGQVDHPEVTRRIARAQEAVLAKGLVLCSWGLDEASLARGHAVGAKMFWFSGTALIASALSRTSDNFKRLQAGSRPTSNRGPQILGEA